MPCSERTPCRLSRRGYCVALLAGSRARPARQTHSRGQYIDQLEGYRGRVGHKVAQYDYKWYMFSRSKRDRDAEKELRYQRGKEENRRTLAFSLDGGG